MRVRPQMIPYIIERVPTLAFGRKANKFSFGRAGIWSAVACKCSLDKKCSLDTSAVRDVLQRYLDSKGS